MVALQLVDNNKQTDRQTDECVPRAMCHDRTKFYKETNIIIIIKRIGFTRFFFFDADHRFELNESRIESSSSDQITPTHQPTHLPHHHKERKSKLAIVHKKIINHQQKKKKKKKKNKMKTTTTTSTTMPSSRRSSVVTKQRSSFISTMIVTTMLALSPGSSPNSMVVYANPASAAALKALKAMDYRYFVAGGTCAAFSHGITTPIDVVKTKLQANPKVRLEK
jgi:hypothetical protein